MSADMRRAIAVGAIIGAAGAGLGVLLLRGRRLRMDRSSLRELAIVGAAILRLLDRLASDRPSTDALPPRAST